MGQTYVYNASEAEESNEETPIPIGIFFDGTANNRVNTLIRKKYYGIEEGKGLSILDGERKIYESQGMERTVSSLWLKKKDKDNSFGNDFTNVARLSFSTDPDKYTIYIEGIGTTDNKDDTTDGLAYGRGKTGIRAKVRKGCEELAKRISEIITKKERRTIVLTLDVFGFSRGAAAARNFLHEINGSEKTDEKVREETITYYEEREVIPTYNNDFQRIAYHKKKRKAILDIDGEEVKSTQYLVNNRYPKLGYLGYYLLSEGILTKEELDKLTLNIRFIGIYDTVASYDKNISYIKSAKNNLQNIGFDSGIESLKLNDIGNFTRATHFIAMNEHRLNFALTRLPQAQEFELPGVHSDIGGSYNDNPNGKEEEVTIIEKTSEEVVDSTISDLKIQGWYKDEQLKKNEYKIINNIGGFLIVKREYSLIGKRVLSKAYSYIPLEFMDRMFKEKISNKEEVFVSETYISEKYSIQNHPILIEAKKKLENYVFNGGEKWGDIGHKELKEKLTKFLDNYENKMVEKYYDDKNNEMVYRLEPVEITAVGGLLGKLRNQYLHWSAHYDGKIFGLIPPMKPTTKRKEY